VGNDNPAHGESVYGVIVSVISLLVSGGLLLLGTFSGEEVFAKPVGPINLGIVCAGFLVLWWAPGAGVLTFRDPFTLLGNGYFSAWAGLVGSVVWMGSLTGARVGADRGPTLALLISSLVVLIAAAERDDTRDADTGWAIALGTISTCFSLFMCFVGPGLTDIPFKVLAVLLICLWIPGAGVLTFEGPFTRAGNGYFGAWAGFLCSAAILLQAFGLRNPILESAGGGAERTEAKQTPAKATAKAPEVGVHNPA